MKSRRPVNSNVMRLLNIFTFALVTGLIVVAPAQVSTDQKAQRAVSVLASFQPNVNWNPATVLSADFNHDGKEDFAFSGTQNGNFVVGIVGNSLEDKSKHWVFRFSIVAPSRNINQICSLNAKIQTRSPVLLGSDNRMWHIPTASRAISLDDGCDAIDITWDQDKKKFELLRIHVIL
jgi:hypothetical protein